MKPTSALVTAPAVALAILSGVAAPVAAASNVEARSSGDDYGRDNRGHDSYGHDSYGRDEDEYGRHGYHKRSGDDHYGGRDDDYSDKHGHYKRQDPTVTKTIVITDPTQWSGLFPSPVTDMTGVVPRDTAQTITIWGGDSQTVVLPTQVTIDTTQVAWVPAPTSATAQGSSGGGSFSQQQQGGSGSHEQSGGQGQGGNQGSSQGQTWHNANTAGFHGGGGWGNGAASAKGVAWTGLALVGLGAAVAAL